MTKQARNILMFAVVALAAPASAQDITSSGRGADMFGAADANSDGFVTLPELQRFQEQRFRAMQQRASQMMQEMFRRSDTNHDGKVSRAEAQAFQSAVRQRMLQRRPQ